MAESSTKAKRTRSLTGCTTCRQRRVKCDEGKPECRNCSLHPLRQCRYDYPCNSHEELLQVVRIPKFDIPPNDDLAITLFSRMSLNDGYRTFLTDSGHFDLVRTSFRQMSANTEAELLASATAFVATGATPGTGRYDTLLRGLIRLLQLKSDERFSGRLLGVSVTLLIGHLVSETTTGWREALHIMVERIMERGGLSACRANSGKFVIERPMLLASHLDMAVMLELLVCYMDGTAPILLSEGCAAWLLSPSSFFETLIHIPKVSIAPLAKIIGLISAVGVDQGPERFEQMAFDAISVGMELENIWPGRLAMRHDPPRTAIGAELCRLGSLAIYYHQIQRQSPYSDSLRLVTRQAALILQSASRSFRDISGWLWLGLMCGYVASEPDVREIYQTILPACRSLFSGKDRSGVAQQQLQVIWDAQDRGETQYCMRNAMDDYPELHMIPI